MVAFDNRIHSRFRVGYAGTFDDVANLSHIWAVAPALVKLALRDDRRSQFNKESPWKRIAKVHRWAMWSGSTT